MENTLQRSLRTLSVEMEEFEVVLLCRPMVIFVGWVATWGSYLSSADYAAIALSGAENVENECAVNELAGFALCVATLMCQRDAISTVSVIANERSRPGKEIYILNDAIYRIEKNRKKCD